MDNQSLAALYQEVNLLLGHRIHVDYDIRQLEKKLKEQEKRIDQLISFIYAKNEAEGELVKRIEYLESMLEVGITLREGKDE